MLKRLIKGHFYLQHIEVKVKSMVIRPALLISSLVFAFLLLTPVAAYAAFNLDTAKDKVLSFILFCVIIVVASAVAMMLARSNVTGAVVLAFAGAIIYGLLDPGAFKDVAMGILNFLGIGGGGAPGAGG